MHNDMYVHMLTQNFTIIDNCHEKCLNKDTKMSYNYITVTHVGSHLICSIEMKDIVS